MLGLTSSLVSFILLSDTTYPTQETLTRTLSTCHVLGLGQASNFMKSEANCQADVIPHA